MNKKTFTLRAFLIIGMAGALGFSSCTDNNYDLNDIDTMIGIGGDGLEFPYLSTKVIPLKDVLELEDNGSVVEDPVNGDYVFRQDGADIDPVHPFIDKITVAQQQTISNDVELVSSSSAGSRRRARTTRAGGSLTADGWLQAFTYEGSTPKEVLDLSTAEVDASLNLTVNFNNVKDVASKFNNITISLPAFMTLSDIQCGHKFTIKGTSISFEDVSTASPLTLTAKVTALNFKEKDETYGTLTLTNGKIEMNGKVHINASATIDRSGSTSNHKISSTMEMGSFVVDAATGRFNPEISLSDLGDMTVNGIPDFLEGGNVVVDLYNPQIKLTTTSDMDIPGVVDGVIKSYKNGQLLATVNINDIPVDPNRTSTICICRRSEGITGFDHVIVNENLSKLIETIPDRITFTANTYADSKNTYRYELDHHYEVTTAYSLDAPIAFGENANIEYRDTLNGWNNDIQDYELAENSYITMDATVSSCVPAYMTIQATPVDVNGNAISADELSVDIDGSIEASKDGVTQTSSPINIKISQKQKGAMKKLDGIIFTVSGKANGEDGAVTGITLNARKHSLKVENIKIKLVGKIIADL